MLLFRVYRKAKRMTKRMVTPRTAETIVIVGVPFSGSGGEPSVALAAALSGVPDRSGVPLSVAGRGAGAGVGLLVVVLLLLLKEEWPGTLVLSVMAAEDFEVLVAVLVVVVMVVVDFVADVDVDVPVDVDVELSGVQSLSISIGMEHGFCRASLSSGNSTKNHAGLLVGIITPTRPM